MKKVGVTGGIGSGKTTICKIFRVLEIPVFNSDIEAKNLINSDEEVKNKLIRTFGNDIYSDNGLNREKMAELVFRDKDALQKMNSIVHPAVRKAFKEWCSNQNSPYVLQEAAILFESGASKNLDKVITVYAPENIRINRVVSRNNVSESEVKNRIQNQMSDEEKIKKSDFVINNYSNYLVIPQVVEIHNQLIR